MNSITYLFIATIITLTIVTMYHISQTKRQIQPLRNDVLVIIYETDLTNDHLKTFEKTLAQNKYRYEVISDTKWKGFGGKIKRLQKHLKGLHPEQIVLISDARDVLSVNYESSELYKKIRADVDESIIVSTEIGCCVGARFKPGELRTAEGKVLKRTYDESPETKNADYAKEWKEMFMKRAVEKNIKHNISIYLNAGVYVGKVKTLLSIYALMNIADDDNDQLIMSEIFYHHPKMFSLDYNRKIFSNSHFWHNRNSKEGSKDSGCYYAYKGAGKDGKSMIVDTYLNSTPFFIHTPAKHFKCYDYVHDMVKKYSN